MKYPKYSFSPFLKGKNEISDNNKVTLGKKIRFKKYKNLPKMEVSDFYDFQ